MFQDLLYAARTLGKSPVFAVTAVVTIALGIGASTAIFSVANAVLLRPLPYKKPDRLVFAISDMRKRNVKDFPFSNANFIDLRNATRDVFTDLAAVLTFRNVVPRADGTLEQIRGGAVTPNFFRTLGATMVVGRDFEEADGVAAPPPPPGTPAGQNPPAPAQTVILSYDYWQRRFGGGTNVLGQGLPGARANSTQIVGVLAPGFELLFSADANLEAKPDFWIAARLAYDNANRNGVSWRAVGRLRDGIMLDRAQSAADAVAADGRRNFVIQETSGYAIRLEPMHKHVVEEVRPALLALIGAVVFLLLIACANVANLMLVRASLKGREFAVRTALGGTRSRLVSQTLAEALLLAGGGAALGIALASLGIRELRAIAPANLPRFDTVAIDAAVLTYSAIAALAAAALFGLVPALRASRPDIAQVLRSSGRTAGLGGGGILRGGVVVAEVALCFVLLIGSGLMFRSFLALERIDPGFDPHGLLTFQLLGSRGGDQPGQRAAFIRDVRARLGAIPGVQSVTAAILVPLGGGYNPIRWGLEPALADPSRYQAVDNQIVIPGFFETMRTPLLAGRGFTDADNMPDRRVVVVDQVLAQKAYPNESAVGKRILLRFRTPEPEWFEIIGVVAHQRATSLADPGREQVYFTDGYAAHGAVNRWILRTSGDAASLAPSVRSTVTAIGSNTLLTEMQPMAIYVEKAQSGTRFSLLLIGVFASIAALLAGVGLYGVLATLVRQRTAEIGVRMALGAAPGSIFGLVVGHGLRLSAAGVAVGLVSALALTRAMTSMLVGVQPTDPITFGGMSILFLAIAAVASWLPARRAAGLDPTAALREE
jgi:putative ABC transport system permease protein